MMREPYIKEKFPKTKDFYSSKPTCRGRDLPKIKESERPKRKREKCFRKMMVACVN